MIAYLEVLDCTGGADQCGCLVEWGGEGRSWRDLI